MSTLHNSILDTIGNTPIVRLARLAPEGVALYAKLEAFNPLGSVKDRLALGVIEAAERDGQLKPGQTVIEATSGNTGIGLAMVCAAKGYPLVIVMAESFRVERRRLMRFLGAQVVLTPASEKGTGMLAKALELGAGARLVPVPAVRERGQRRRPLADYGAGILRRLRRHRPRLLGHRRRNRRDAEGRGPSAAGREPGDADHGCRARKCADARQRHRARSDREDGTPAESHPLFRPHPVQGWSPDFIPRLTADAIDGRKLTNQVRHRLCPGSPWDRDTVTSRLKSDAACAA